MIISPVNFLKSNSPQDQNQPVGVGVAKKYRATCLFWQCSTVLITGLAALFGGYTATPAVAQPRIIEQYWDMNNVQNVRAIQDALRRLGFFNYPQSTGTFGDLTRGAVLNFQRANNLPVTGVVDNITANAIFARDQGRDTQLTIADGNRERFCRESINRNEICPYVVLIPGDNSRLLEIRQRLLASPYPPLATHMILEDHSRGLFIRIDQYRNRGEAELVANILRNNISPNFRVEYLPNITPTSSRG